MNLDHLSRQLTGSVVAAHEPAFAAHHDRLIWNGRKPARQARIILRAASVADVQHGVRFAAAHGLSVAPRGGGHHMTGVAARADMVIDLGALAGMQIDAASRSARIGPAVTNLQLAQELDRHGLGFPLGHCASVPMSGYLLAGGVGWNSGAWGMACGLVKAARVVLADGRCVTASPRENPDLFWAVRGGGPCFFGVVTDWELALKPAPAAIETVVRVYPGTMAHPVAEWAEQAMTRAPAEVEFTVQVTPGPQGPVLAAIATVFADSTVSAAEIHRQLGLGAPPALETIGPMSSSLAGLYQATEPSVPAGLRYRSDSLWSDAGFDAVLARMVAAMAHAPSERSFVVLTLAPKAAPLPLDAAFSLDGRIFAAVYALWTDAAEDARNADWLHRLGDDVAPLAQGAYAGLCDLDRPGGTLPCHSAEAAMRLADLRNRFDPDGLFGTPLFATALAAE